MASLLENVGRRGHAALRAATRRLLPAERPAPAEGAAPLAPVVVDNNAAVYPTRPPLPLPEGQSEDTLRRTLQSFSIDGSPRGALDGYIADSFERFIYTYGLARDLEGTALELGANPYFTSHLLRRHTKLQPVYANYFGEAGRGTDMTQTISYEECGETHTVEIASHLFNLEEDRFPFADATFDVVFFCEIIEHLLIDPTHPLREINRVLGNNGILILTTPNLARLETVLRVIAGEGTGDPYSGNGPYGRHNREYTLHELSRLLNFCGFTLEVAFTADSYRSDMTQRFGYAETIPLLRRRENDLGHYIFIRARKVAEPRAGLPSFLFNAYPPERISIVEL